ncbi:helix-turn-helix domain-containing protein [Kutzneria sp. NPDC051319]|uniref:helix-turn-helix domain-containing protein n=1 Tax=Kutzneria sp. NPDC051319 TaxID=3155047 RepID=UPI003426CF58
MPAELATVTDVAEAGDVPISTLEEARARADRIRVGIGVVAQLQDDVVTAYQRRDWTQLGYGTWEEYVAGEFGGHHVRLPRPQRQEIVARLHEEGLSTRAIGVALGVDQRTVRRDLPAEADTVPVPVVGVDGKSYATPGKPSAEADTEPGPAESGPAESGPPRRRPLHAEAAEAAATLDAALSRWDAVTADSRWPAQRTRIAEKHSGTIARAAALVENVTA